MFVHIALCVVVFVLCWCYFFVNIVWALDSVAVWLCKCFYWRRVCRFNHNVSVGGLSLYLVLFVLLLLLLLLLSPFLRCCHYRLCINICRWRARISSSRFKFAMLDQSLCTGGAFTFWLLAHHWLGSSRSVLRFMLSMAFIICFICCVFARCVPHCCVGGSYALRVSWR